MAARCADGEEGPTEVQGDRRRPAGGLSWCGREAAWRAGTGACGGHQQPLGPRERLESWDGDSGTGPTQGRGRRAEGSGSPARASARACAPPNTSGG